MKDRKHNTGSYNTGHCNSGIYNAGHYNTGDDNTGSRNTGSYNTGHCNSGIYNAGHCNTGCRNTGHYNAGNYNTGNFNTCDYSTGFFNTVAGTVRMFNKDTGLRRDQVYRCFPRVTLPLTEWVSVESIKESEVTEEIKTCQGYLLKRTYKEAWAIVWAEMTESARQKFLDLPNFDPAIFEEITGIDVNSDEIEVVANGKKVIISKESAKSLGLID